MPVPRYFAMSSARSILPTGTAHRRRNSVDVAAEVLVGDGSDLEVERLERDMELGWLERRRRKRTRRWIWVSGWPSQSWAPAAVQATRVCIGLLHSAINRLCSANIKVVGIATSNEHRHTPREPPSSSVVGVFSARERTTPTLLYEATE